MSVEPYREKLLKTILDLIEDKGVTQFYSGFRGDFDAFCSSLIFASCVDTIYSNHQNS